MKSYSQNCIEIFFFQQQMYAALTSSSNSIAEKFQVVLATFIYQYKFLLLQKFWYHHFHCINGFHNSSHTHVPPIYIYIYVYIHPNICVHICVRAHTLQSAARTLHLISYYAFIPTQTLAKGFLYSQHCLLFIHLLQ